VLVGHIPLWNLFGKGVCHVILGDVNICTYFLDHDMVWTLLYMEENCQINKLIRVIVLRGWLVEVNTIESIGKNMNISVEVLGVLDGEHEGIEFNSEDVWEFGNNVNIGLFIVDTKTCYIAIAITIKECERAISVIRVSS
jgi:hypothetical protein